MFSKVASFLGDFKTIGVSASIAAICQFSQSPLAKRVQQVALLTFGVGVVVRAVHQLNPLLRKSEPPAPVKSDKPVSSPRGALKSSGESFGPKILVTQAPQDDGAFSPLAASTFQALEAMDAFGKEFESVYSKIKKDSVSLTVEYMYGQVIERGLKNYRKMVSQNPETNLEMVNLQEISNKQLIPSTIKFEAPIKVAFESESSTHEAVLSKIKDHFYRKSGTKVCWLRNSKNESFALIGNQGRVIFFSSNDGQLFEIDAEESLDWHLKVKLQIMKLEKGIFDFALGTFTEQESSGIL